MQTTNLVVMLGYVANDLVAKEYENKTKSVQFSIKTRDFHNGVVDKNFHNVIMWNSLCEHATSILKKGDVIQIQGRLKNKKVELRDGTKRNFVEIVISEWTKVKDGDSFDEAKIED